ncbi:Clathrin adaptor, mu subunit, C-terminal [Ostreococcus tauri]|uniref:Clathrin adaptor, mu subunit, C-terminal n=1 Tax=Ostreococcus tauri TaxID=70448 RepID=Q00U04_OSTTA|nr:Clathrin adaptor, mu subunit, C-terminal [Ostreococcus tauri]CAL58245.1 Clathrin adaptor, mu subunit, C-terminal [Ostreococcus tauri]|eukprot:XP_003083696.1 Clathrin adaptor, mu subunit, C-terminal [Ostreococcus tauri]
MAHCVSGVFVVNLRGDVLITRAYRDEIDRTVLDAFRTQILLDRHDGKSVHARAARRRRADDGSRTNAPKRVIGSVTYFMKRSRDVYVVGVRRGTANAATRARDGWETARDAAAFTFLSHVVRLCRQYFGACDEGAIRENFVLLYELLDEICDDGYPQITAGESLRHFITQKSAKSESGMSKEEIERKTAKEQRRAVEAAKQVTSSVAWRRPGLVYKKNEVYLDIVESVNLMMSAEGTVLRSSVQGSIMMKAFLSGMPDLSVGLNDRLGEHTRVSATGEDAGASAARNRKLIDLDDLQFHQCVRLHKFASEKVIEFTPPDGEFELVRYRVSDNVTLPFKLMPAVKELGRTRLAMSVNLRSLYDPSTVANEVRVRIPVPKLTARATIRVSAGKAKYVPEEGCLRWKIKKLAGHQELQLDAEVMLANTLSDHKPWVQPPINIEFNVPMFTASGLRIRFLNVEERNMGNYDVTRWVRYLCQSGDGRGSYEIRVDNRFATQ